MISNSPPTSPPSTPPIRQNEVASCSSDPQTLARSIQGAVSVSDNLYSGNVFLPAQYIDKAMDQNARLIRYATDKRHVEMEMQHSDPLTSVREERLTITINRIDQDNNNNTLRDIQYSLRNATILRGQNPERSALLLGHHVIGALINLPLTQKIVLIDKQDRYWSYWFDTSKTPHVLLREICPVPSPGNILILLPRPTKITTSPTVEGENRATQLLENSTTETRPPAYDPYFVCLVPASVTQTKWIEIPRAEPTQYGITEQLPDAVATGVNLFTSSNKLLAPSIDAFTLRSDIYENFLLQNNVLESVSAQTKQDRDYLEASDILWRALNAGPDLTSIDILASYYHAAVEKVIGSQNLLAQLLTIDQFEGRNISQQLSIMSENSCTDYSCQPPKLRASMDDLISHHLKLLLRLCEGGTLPHEDLLKSFRKGGDASLENLFTKVLCSPELDQLYYRVTH
ncbi:hypothetical protein [Glaciimonas immobilis]|uniref:Uncharacterized protein n=1 Tax=Glaciimonas immobilis TaxID=728004 RepID=A0A840RQT3_9BURK|nr:hypothetical protein [Glaciimonas immobilis]KAF3997978.1 hypothetical protein HAV38_10455 [Glaciimonas immobilis]MBB5199348.1 hypothetical protein [Glaciimonas immobilis]